MSTRGWLSLSRFLLASSLVVLTSLSAHAEDAASLPAPPLALSVTPAAGATGGGGWKVRLENTGDLPVRIAADPRLLVLEVTPPSGFVDPTLAKGKKPAATATGPVRCVLPDDARPATDEGRELVVPAKRSWSATIDPFLYCFGPRERAMLVSGATVKAMFGWPAPLPKPGAKPSTKIVPVTAPFVASPVGAAVGHLAPVKFVEAAPFSLTENVAPAPALPGPEPVTVTMPDSLDAARGAEIATSVTVTNVGDKALTLLFRPETLMFRVAGPAGSVACGSTRVIGSPIRELYSTLGVKGRASTSVLITAVCPTDTFDTPGLYRVTPVLDTSGASGRAVGLKTWDGTATGSAPMLLRIRTPRRSAGSVTRPSLD